ncbi:MAG: methylated-DNA--[protein]-cysteine S-methyltransferase, partial [Chloroflexota bacterium]
EYPSADIQYSPAHFNDWVTTIVEHLTGHHPHLTLPLDLQATAFQRQVWDVLRTIPYGQTASYSEVARKLGQPKATRAVARACATNPAALVIPCHRVIREDGGLGGYRWGIERKQAILAAESNHQPHVESE